MANEAHKIKLLVLWDILCKNTDENHALNTDEISELLALRGLNVSRKILVQDIATLCDNGYEVLSYKKKYHYYYVVNRSLETAEVVMLADVINASKLPVAQKKALVGRLAETLCTHQAESISKHIISLDKGRKGSSSFIYNVDAIECAINENKQISFFYFNYDEKHKKVYRKNGNRYIVSPAFMVWNKDNYYLLFYLGKSGYAREVIPEMHASTSKYAMAMWYYLFTGQAKNFPYNKEVKEKETYLQTLTLYKKYKVKTPTVDDFDFWLFADCFSAIYTEKGTTFIHRVQTDSLAYYIARVYGTNYVWQINMNTQIVIEGKPYLDVVDEWYNYMKALNMSSLNLVRTYILALENSGRIERTRLGNIDMLPKLKPSGVAITPIVGSIACGQPVDAVEQIEESVTLPRAIFGGGDLFILHTHGDSMIDIGIKHGDLVVIRKQNTAENGDIIVAMMNGETTLKRFYKRNGKVVLHPENKEMKDIIVKDCEIQGVLVSCIHIYN